MIERWHDIDVQFSRIGKHSWSVARLIQLSKKLPVMDIPLLHLNVYFLYEKLTLREMVTHFNAVISSDLSFPIIMDEDGEILDGRHRIMKALIDGKESIKAVRFLKNPEPCKIND